MDLDKTLELATKIMDVLNDEKLSPSDGMHILMIILASGSVFFNASPEQMKEMLGEYIEYFESNGKMYNADKLKNIKIPWTMN